MNFLKGLITKNIVLYKILSKLNIVINNFFIIQTFRRYLFARSYYTKQLKLIRAWSIKKTENDNFYYDLSDINLNYLVSLICAITNAEYEEVESYALEIRKDLNLKQHIKSHFESDISLRDTNIEFGRRIGWYIFVRLLKPKLVVETGVHHGVGACVISAALMRNSFEGFLGKYLGTEINDNAGNLLTEPYDKYGQIIFGDSIETLINLEEKIDIFINDSNHDRNYEYTEYETILNKLRDDFVILGDNSHVSDSLSEFAKTNNFQYLFFKEEPKNHWYPGAGIGICFKLDNS